MAMDWTPRLPLIVILYIIVVSQGCSSSSSVPAGVDGTWVFVRFLDQSESGSAGFLLPATAAPFDLDEVFRQGRYVQSEEYLRTGEVASLTSSAIEFPLSILVGQAVDHFEVVGAYEGRFDHRTAIALPPGAKYGVWHLHRFEANPLTEPLFLLPSRGIVLNASDALRIGVCLHSETELQELIERNPGAIVRPILAEDLNPAGTPVLSALNEADLTDVLRSLREDALSR